MKTNLQSCLECLDRHNDKMISVYREMLEIRTRITELLDNVQSEATVVESDTRDSNAHLQAVFDDKHQHTATVAPNAILPLLPTLDLLGLPQPLALHGRLSDLNRDPLEFGMVGSLPEDIDPIIYQRSPGKFAIIFGLSLKKTFTMNDRRVAL
jgi:hypothetical protein